MAIDPAKEMTQKYECLNERCSRYNIKTDVKMVRASEYCFVHPGRVLCANCGWDMYAIGERRL